MANGRALAAAIPHAELVEWEGIDHVWAFAPNWREIHNDQIEFLTGIRPGSGVETMIGTVMFTDIVNSTQQVSALGDERWREVMALHDSVTSWKVTERGGALVRSTGDGVLATFLDPAMAISAALELKRDLASSGISIRVC